MRTVFAAFSMVCAFAGVVPAVSGEVDPKVAAELKRIAEMSTADRIEIYAQQNPAMRVVSQYSEFKKALAERIADAPFKMIQISGFSGAGLQDVDKFKASVRNKILGAADDFSGPVVVVLGGSKDGIGAAYEVTHELRQSGVKLIIAGMVAAEVAKYHLEGQVQGWGDVISPYQDILLLLNTVDNGWELLESADGSSRTVDIMRDFLSLSNAVGVEYAMYQGAKFGFNELVEFSARADGWKNANKLSLSLYPSVEPSPKKVAQGKDAGFRAAMQAAQFLGENNLLREIGSARLVFLPVDENTKGESFFPLQVLRVPQGGNGESLSHLMKEYAESLPAKEAALKAAELVDPKSPEANIARAEVNRVLRFLETREMARGVLMRVKSFLQKENVAAKERLGFNYEHPPRTEDQEELDLIYRLEKSMNLIMHAGLHIDSRINEKASVSNEKASVSKIATPVAQGICAGLVAAKAAAIDKK